MSNTALISLGSNLGDRELNLLRAVAETGKLAATRITALSSFYETAPVGPVEQPDFLNAVLSLETALSPLELLRELQRIESGVFRRVRLTPQGPRPIDLDILLYEDAVLDLPDLKVPHPRMAERLFVLEPLAEIAPNLRHPLLGETAEQLLCRLRASDGSQKVRRA